MVLHIKNKKCCFIIVSILIFLMLILTLFYWFTNKDILVIKNNSTNTISYVKIHINDSDSHMSDTIVIENINPGEFKKIKMRSELLRKGSGSWGYQYKIQDQSEISIRHFSNNHFIIFPNKIELQFSDSEILVLEGLVFQRGKPDALNLNRSLIF